MKNTGIWFQNQIIKDFNQWVHTSLQAENRSRFSGKWESEAGKAAFDSMPLYHQNIIHKIASVLLEKQELLHLLFTSYYKHNGFYYYLNGVKTAAFQGPDQETVAKEKIAKVLKQFIQGQPGYNLDQSFLRLVDLRRHISGKEAKGIKIDYWTIYLFETMITTTNLKGVWKYGNSRLIQWADKSKGKTGLLPIKIENIKSQKTSTSRKRLWLVAGTVIPILAISWAFKKFKVFGKEN